MVLRRGYAVYFTPTFKLVQQLLAAKKELRLEAALKKLDRFEAIILEFDGESLRVSRPKEKCGGNAAAHFSPSGSTASLAPDGAKDSVPPEGLTQRAGDRP